MAALYAAFPFPDMADRTAAVRDDLYLDVAGIRQVLFDKYRGIAERALRLRAAPPVGRLDVRGVPDHAHAPSATACHGLDHDCRAVGSRREEGAGLLQGNRPCAAGGNRYAAVPGECPARALFPSRLSVLGWRADESQSRRFDGGRKFGVFAQESVTGMHRIACIVWQCRQSARYRGRRPAPGRTVPPPRRCWWRAATARRLRYESRQSPTPDPRRRGPMRMAISPRLAMSSFFMGSPGGIRRRFRGELCIKSGSRCDCPGRRARRFAVSGGDSRGCGRR